METMTSHKLQYSRCAHLEVVAPLLLMTVWNHLNALLKSPFKMMTMWNPRKSSAWVPSKCIQQTMCSLCLTNHTKYTFISNLPFKKVVLFVLCHWIIHMLVVPLNSISEIFFKLPIISKGALQIKPVKVRLTWQSGWNLMRNRNSSKKRI